MNTSLYDIHVFLRDHWDEHKFEFPRASGQRDVPDLTPAIERDILALALLKAYDYIPEDICKKIKESHGCCEFHYCSDCTLSWLIGQGAEAWVARRQQIINEMPKEAKND